MKRASILVICLTMLLSSYLSHSIVHSKTYSTYKTSFSLVTRKSMKNIMLKWYKNADVSGYEIDYAQDENFLDATTKVITKKSTTSLTLKGLPKKDYYIRIRGYKKTDDETLYGPYRRCKVIAWNSKWKYAGSSKIHKDAAVLFYAATNRKDTVVCINPGHGTKNGTKYKTWCHPNHTKKVTGGSTPKGAYKAVSVTGGTTMTNKMSEAAANLKVVKKAKSLLLAEGYDVLMVRQDSNAQLDNVARTVYANNNANCHVTIHFDSSACNKGAFYISVPKVTSYRKMTPVKKNYKKHNSLGKNIITSLKSKGVKMYGKGHMAVDLTQTSYSTVPSVDIEIGDRTTSTKASMVNKMAKGIVAGVKKYFKD